MTTSVHLIGIGGSGLSGIARVLLESGYTVSGSDRLSSPLAESLRADGVRVCIGHQASNITGVDLVVRSSAIPDDNPEVLAALAAGIPVLKRSEFLGQLMQGKQSIAIAGSHGKTTTSAMIAWMLVEAGLDPSFIVGGVLKNLGVNARAGAGQPFVIEADEYDHMFLGLNPDIAVITNIEYDHPDCYPTPAEYRQAFLDFASRLAPDGWLLACSDDPGAANLSVTLSTKHGFQGKIETYGLNDKDRSQASYRASQLAPNAAGGFSFKAVYHAPDGSAVPLGDVTLQAPGVHNVRNALAALAVGHHLDIPSEQVAHALGAYQGSGRRFEVVGEPRGIALVNDYAHHPTEIRATLAAARVRYPGRRLWAVWQPHTYSRTQALQAEFSTAFNDADQVVVTEIYAAREPAQAFSSASLAASMLHPSAHFVPSLDEGVRFLLAHLAPGDVVLVLSAGDADQVIVQLLAALENKKA
ncbi:MAG TPA: UDP-N-acetylmuramate--L-alanine ligase [Anaerolineaceae bacterium]